MAGPFGLRDAETELQPRFDDDDDFSEIPAFSKRRRVASDAAAAAAAAAAGPASAAGGRKGQGASSGFAADSRTFYLTEISAETVRPPAARPLQPSLL